MLEKKKVIVTGGSQSIGTDIALAMAESGANVLIQYHSSEKTVKESHQMIKERGGDAFMLQSDFFQEEEMLSFTERSIQMTNGVDTPITKIFLNVQLEGLRVMHRVNSVVPMILTHEMASLVARS